MGSYGNKTGLRGKYYRGGENNSCGGFVVIRVHSWSFVVIRGHSWSFVVIRGHSWLFVVIRGHSWSFVVICSAPAAPRVIYGYSWLLLPTGYRLPATGYWLSATGHCRLATADRQ
ncbi:MAG TPA: hypothetical protein PKI34_08905 [Bacteroidales bacterium]|nr:hypothetical protein [Bacteroidales bacterium]